MGGLSLFVFYKVRAAGVSPDLWRRNPVAAIARLTAVASSDIQFVSENDEAKTVTIRERKTGKKWTLKLEQARKGGFGFSGEDEMGHVGRLDLGQDTAPKPPPWVPLYPNAKTSGNIVLTGTSSEGEGGLFTLTTSDPVDKVLAFYQDEITNSGLTVETRASIPGGASITATENRRKRSLTVMVNGGNDQTLMMIFFGATLQSR